MEKRVKLLNLYLISYKNSLFFDIEIKTENALYSTEPSIMLTFYFHLPSCWSSDFEFPDLNLLK